jgi:Uma2 family endonuclease
VSTAEQTTFTAADLLAMPDGDRFELVDGKLVERDMGMESSVVAGRVFLRIGAFVEQHHLGWAAPEGTAYQCFEDDRERVRKPDASFVARGRFPNDTPPRGHCRIAPDLAVEVVSPNDSYYDVEHKVQEYLAAGVKQVWVVNPDRRNVRIHRLDGTTTDLDENDEITGEDVLPGFTCRVGEFFLPRG